jgi:hypothetical protein
MQESDYSHQEIVRSCLENLNSPHATLELQAQSFFQAKRALLAMSVEARKGMLAQVEELKVHAATIVQVIQEKMQELDALYKEVQEVVDEAAFQRYLKKNS